MADTDLSLLGILPLGRALILTHSPWIDGFTEQRRAGVCLCVCRGGGWGGVALLCVASVWSFFQNSDFSADERAVRNCLPLPLKKKRFFKNLDYV